MEETKIWTIEGTAATPLNTTNQMESEGLLENILTQNPDMLEEGLELVGRQTSTAGGPLDLLGVDIYGKLVVFELKRGRLNREAVAQVIDYASYLNAMDTESLYSHIAERSGNLGIQKIDDFGDWYNALKANSELPDEESESLTPPRTVLVGLGIDETTERMVNYMADLGFDISLLTFHGFTNSEGRTLLARNVEVERSDETVSTPRKPRAYNRRARFERSVQSLSDDMRTTLDKVERMLSSVGNRFTRIYSTRRLSFLVDFSWSEEFAWNDETRAKRRYLSFIEVDNDHNCISVGFTWIATRLASEEFKKIADGGGEYKVPIHSPQEWDAREEELTALTRKVYEAYNAAREKVLSMQ